jgi:hypothetical protein
VTTTPRVRIASACAAVGREAVIRQCVELLSGHGTDPGFLVTIGGFPAERFLAAGRPENQMYWSRVWALRALLWSSPGDHVSILRDALEDPHWRVREMACKVVARHTTDEVLDAVEVLRWDDVTRVRRAADRAIFRIVESGRWRIADRATSNFIGCNSSEIVG